MPFICHSLRRECTLRASPFCHLYRPWTNLGVAKAANSLSLPTVFDLSFFTISRVL